MSCPSSKTRTPDNGRSLPWVTAAVDEADLKLDVDGMVAEMELKFLYHCLKFCLERRSTKLVRNMSNAGR